MYKIDFSKPIHIHFIGIGGISMSGLAEILHEEGFTISGSDSKESDLTKTLAAKGIKVIYGQSADNITSGIDLVVYTAAIHESNPEFAAAKAAGIRGEVTEIGWGNQIRSYVMQPYTMVKDHRTGVESGNVDAVMDGGLDPFINGYLKWLSLGCPKSMEDENE